jgi:NDP-sugar pyrophosphorylase family protein
MINAGIYILEPEVLQHVPASAPSMFEHHLFPFLLKMGEPIFGYHSDSYWIDIGTPEKYLKGHHDLLLRWGDGDEGVRTEGKSKIHPTIQIEGPVLIAEGCAIAKDVYLKGPIAMGPRCKVAKGAVIEAAVLWQDSKVGEQAVLRNCVVASNSSIQRGSHVLANCVLGDNVTVGKENILAPGTKIWPNRRLEPNTLLF